jgi:3-oxoadipate enol-lactonase
MQTLKLSTGLQINYLEEHSSGENSVILLHGLGATCDSWQLQVPALAEAGFRVVAPDMRGFGGSSYPHERLSIRTYARDLVALMEELELPSAALVGISMGGTIALQTALDYPSKVTRLVLANTFGRLRPNQRGDWIYFAWRYLLVHTIGLPAQARIVSERLFPNPEQAEFRELFMQQVLQSDPTGYRAAIRALAGFNVMDRLKEIAFPTLVITGQDDTTVDPELQRSLATKISGAQQMVISNAGHAVSIDQPAEFNRILLDFLNAGILSDPIN